MESLDDFYLLGSNMVLLQTTNNVFNTSLYKYVQPKSLLAWQRVRVANMMAHNGRQWADIFSKYNSGEKLKTSPSYIDKISKIQRSITSENFRYFPSQ